MEQTQMNVIFSAGHPQYIGVGDTLELNGSRGIEKFVGSYSEIIKAFDEWNEHMSVNEGEQGGFFKIKGAWFGSYSDLETGKAIFLSPEQLFQQIQLQVEEIEESAYFESVGAE
jgi:hypothetical protein